VIHSQWISYSDLLKSETPLKQKIKRFNTNFDNQLQLKNLNSHLFYDKDYIDEEEGDDQFIEFAPTKNGYRSEEFEEYLKKKFLNNELQYINFDRNTLKVDRVVSCSEMFDIIHPKKAGKIMSKWSDSIVKIVQILINFRYQNVSPINFRSIMGFSS